MADGDVVRELRVFAMDPVRRVTTLRHTTEDLDEACERAAALRQQGLRVRVTAHRRRKVLTVKPHTLLSETRRHREQVAMEMSDRADSLKRYKSPG